jgi:hypothetical protein
MRIPAATARMARGKRGSAAALSSPAAAASTDALSGLSVAARSRRSSSPARAAAAAAAGVSISMDGASLNPRTFSPPFPFFFGGKKNSSGKWAGEEEGGRGRLRGRAWRENKNCC